MVVSSQVNDFIKVLIFLKHRCLKYVSSLGRGNIAAMVSEQEKTKTVAL